MKDLFLSTKIGSSRLLGSRDSALITRPGQTITTKSPTSQTKGGECKGQFDSKKGVSNRTSFVKPGEK